MRLRTSAFGLALLLTGCAHSSLVLLPDEDGGHGAVAIRKTDTTAVETLVSEPNSRTSIGSRPTTRPLGAKGLSAREEALLASLPPAPKSFSLYFLEGTTELTATSLTRLDEIRADIARRPGVEVEVTGHTDTVGDPGDNDALSRKRADEVVELLASKGFERTIMSAVGRGERELQVPTDDNVSSPVNRRVEIIAR
jgi:outer membrane protein OmpA-like peptidoglycan-associated protein